MIDSELKPWLLEVNLSPALGTDSPLDTFIKSNLIADTLNLINVWKFNWRKEISNKMATWAKNITNTKSIKQKMMQKYSSLLWGTFDEKSKEPKTSNNRIHSVESSKDEYYNFMMRKQGIFLDNNEFYP